MEAQFWIVGDHQRAFEGAVVEVERAEVHHLHQGAVEHRRFRRWGGGIKVVHDAPHGGESTAAREQGDRRNRLGRPCEHDTGAGRRCGKVGGPQADPTLERGAERQPRKLVGAPLERCRRNCVVRDQGGERLRAVDLCAARRPLGDLPVAVARRDERQRRQHERDVALGRPVPRRVDEAALGVLDRLDGRSLPRVDGPAANLYDA